MSETPDERPTDEVRVTVQVRVDREETFRLFTEEIDQWWRRGPRYRAAGVARGIIHLEPKPGGRLFESFETEDGESRVVATGHVTVWEPPERFVLRWRNTNFLADEETRVEVLFESTRSGTRVTLSHTGWAAIRPDHPARHGLGVGPDFVRMLGMWWAELLGDLRHHARDPRGAH